MTKAQAIAGLISALPLIVFPARVLAGPASDLYQLESFSFAGGAQIGASSSSFTMDSIVGNVLTGNASSDIYTLDAGVTLLGAVSPPPAPTLTNPGSTYDRLKLVVDPGGASNNTRFAIAISDDNWVTTQFVQNDFSIGSTLGTEDWLTYCEWGDATGKIITGLAEDTTYRVKAKAKQGSSQSAYGPDSSATTSVPSLSFGIDSNVIEFDPLIPANSRTDATKHTVLTTSTNAYNGYIVYVHSTGPLANGAHTIDDYVSPNSAPTAWAGFGFGYTTNDASLSGGLADRFADGGPKYAGFTTSAPGDPVADHVAKVEGSPIVDEQFTVSYKVAAPETAVAGTYKTTLLYVVVPAY